MEAVLKSAPKGTLCMGNIDPVAQFAEGTPESMRASVKELLSKCGKYSDFIPSSGCDIPAHAKWENIDAFFGAFDE